MNTQEKTDILLETLAHYFDCDINDINKIAVIIETRNPDGMKTHYCYSGAPHWDIIGLLAEFKAHLEHVRASAIMNDELNP